MAITMHTFRWTEEEYSIKQLIEDHGRYLPFCILVTEGYSCPRLEITSDEMYWVHEIAEDPCVVVRDEEGRLFRVPECVKQEVVPLARINEDSCTSSRRRRGRDFTQLAGAMTLEQFRTSAVTQYFRFHGDKCKEVYDDMNDGVMIRLGILELVDTYKEKFLVGYPFMAKPREDLAILNMQLRGRSHRAVTYDSSSGQLYPVPTMIPVYLPLANAIAVVGNNNMSDHKFFKMMYEFRDSSKNCDHDYVRFLRPDAEIMIFKEEPVDKIYDYIDLTSLLEDRKNLPQNDQDDDSDDKEDYEDIDDKISAAVTYRIDPVALTADFPLKERMDMLKNVYETGVLPLEEVVDDGTPPELPTRWSPASAELPVTHHRSDVSVAHNTGPPPPVPKRCPTFKSTMKYPAAISADRSPNPCAIRTTPQITSSFAEMKTYNNVMLEKLHSTMYNQVVDPPPAPPTPRPPPPPVAPRPPLPPDLPITPPAPDLPITPPAPVATVAPTIMKTHDKFKRSTHPEKRTEISEVPTTQTLAVALRKLKPVVREMEKRASATDNCRAEPRDGRENWKLGYAIYDDCQEQNNQPTMTVQTMLVQPNATKCDTSDELSINDAIDRDKGEPLLSNSFDKHTMETQDDNEVNTQTDDHISLSDHPGKINSFEDIPKDLSSLSVSQLVECLALLNMAHRADNMERHLVDGEMLQALDLDILVNEMGFTKMEATIITKFAGGWRPKVL